MTTTATTDATPKSRTERASDVLLVIIVLAVGAMAGAASFRHVHDWTLDHSPADTASWLGWANAVITELVPTASLIIIARRRRTGGHTGYPMFLLVVAVGFSLTAQLAVAEYSTFGWMVSALPSLAFFALSKLVFSATKRHPAPATAPATTPEPDPARWEELVNRVNTLETRPHNPVPATAPTGPARATSTDTATGSTAPTADTTTTATLPSTRPETSVSTIAPTATPVPVPAAASTGGNVRDRRNGHGQATDDLLPGARLYADSHRQTHGVDITPGQLAVRLRTDTTTATRLLKTINSTPTVGANA